MTIPGIHTHSQITVTLLTEKKVRILRRIFRGIRNRQSGIFVVRLGKRRLVECRDGGWQKGPEEDRG